LLSDDHALALASAPDVPAAVELPRPKPLADDVFVWFVYEDVPVPVTLLPEPAIALDVPSAEPLSVAVKWPKYVTLAAVLPPDVESEELDVPVPPAKAATEDIARIAAKRAFFMTTSKIDVYWVLNESHANNSPNVCGWSTHQQYLKRTT
jgi:hypothetical protein